MQPFALTVEGSSDTISDELAAGLSNVFTGDTVDQHSADVAHSIAGAAVDLIAQAPLGDEVIAYVVSVTGTQTAGAGYTGLDSIHLHVGATGRSIAQPAGDGEPASQV